MSDSITVTSTLFDDGTTIPGECAHGSVGGENVSPDLAWSGLPEGTESIAVSCWDPDAPTTVGFCHWIVANLPAGATSLERGAGEPGQAPSGSVFGLSDWGEPGWGGMAPPAGDPPHRYQFTVFALDTPSLGIDERTTYAKFRFLLRGHVLATGSLTGLFSVSS